MSRSYPGGGLHFPVNPISTKSPYLFHPHMTLNFSFSDTQNTLYKLRLISTQLINPHKISSASSSVKQRIYNENKISDNYFHPKIPQNHTPNLQKLLVNQALSRTPPLYKEITPLTHP